MLPVADALLIGQHVDAVLFSILRDVSRLPKVHAAYQRLASLGIRMLGAIVTGAQTDHYGSEYQYVVRSRDARLNPTAAPRIPMRQTLPVATALVLVIAAGLVHGHWTRRWAPSQAVQSAAARLERIPMTLGDWQGQRRRSTAGSSTWRRSPATSPGGTRTAPARAPVTVLLVCGRPGPISVHTPDICYAGAGFEPLKPPSRVTLPCGILRAAGRVLDGRSEQAGAAGPTISASSGPGPPPGLWEAPDNPRLAFAPRQVLVQAVRDPHAGLAQRSITDPKPGLSPGVSARAEAVSSSGLVNHDRISPRAE